MKKQKSKPLSKKILSIILIIAMIINLILLANGSIDPFLFWIILGICALIAYIVVLKKKK